MAAIEFPTPTAAGEEFVAAGITYTWNGTGWTTSAAAGPPPVDAYTKVESDAKYVELTGDVMSGGLAITMPQAVLSLNKPDTSSQNVLLGSTGGINRWAIYMGDGGSQGGNDDYLVSTFDASGHRSTPLHINWDSGDITVGVLNSNTRVTVNSPGGAQFTGGTDGVTRWTMYLGDLTASGADFSLNRYDDAGVIVDPPALHIDRANGIAHFSAAVYSKDMIVQQQPNLGNMHYNFINAAGVQIGSWFWDSALNLMAVRNMFNGVTVTDSDLSLAHGGAVVAGKGIVGRQGSQGGGIAGLFNISWNGAGGMHLWVDQTNLGTITVSSDYRMKKDVVDLGSMWDVVKLLRPISYTHTEYGTVANTRENTIEPLVLADGIERWGFIAHELQETLIESAASGVKDAPNLIQSPNPFTLIAALTKALQEAMTRIEALEAAAPAARR